MKTLYMIKGLPGCGKTTKAKSMQAKMPNLVRVNKDDLRLQLHNGGYSNWNEKLIVNARDMLIGIALEAGNHVVSDDTNLAPKHETRLKQLAKNNGAKFELIDMTDITPEECIKRDLQRERSVGSEVIMSMYNQFLRPPIPVIERNEDLPDVYLCDIDGTVAKMDGRSPYNWDKVGSDKPNTPIIGIIEKIIKTGSEVIFVSGRDESCILETGVWLKENIKGIPMPFTLLMRPKGDMRKDTVVKEEIYNTHIKGKYNAVAIFDDRRQVVQMWRGLGLTVLQVDEGNF